MEAGLGSDKTWVLCGSTWAGSTAWGRGGVVKKEQAREANGAPASSRSSHLTRLSLPSPPPACIPQAVTRHWCECTQLVPSHWKLSGWRRTARAPVEQRGWYRPAAKACLGHTASLVLAEGVPNNASCILHASASFNSLAPLQIVAADPDCNCDTIANYYCSSEQDACPSLTWPLFLLVRVVRCALELLEYTHIA